MDLSGFAQLFDFGDADPSWLLLVFVILGWNAVHSYIAHRQKSRELDIEFFGKNVTAYTHESNRVKANLALDPNVTSVFASARRTAAAGRAPAVPINASVASVPAAPVLSAGPAASAASMSVASVPASGTTAPASSLPVAAPDEVSPIDTLRIPLQRSGAMLFIGGYPDLRVAADQVAFRVAFVQVKGKLEMLGTFPAEQDEEAVIRSCLKMANKRLAKILRTTAASEAASNRSANGI